MDENEIAKVDVPAGSLAAQLVADAGFGDYTDAYAVRIDPAVFPDVDAFASAFVRRPPAPIVALLRVRDALVGWLGIATTNGGTRIFVPRVRDEREIVYGQDDKHLDFRVSLLHDGEREIVSTIVRMNGALGRIYFFPVAPAHRRIVPAMMRAAMRSAA